MTRLSTGFLCFLVAAIALWLGWRLTQPGGGEETGSTRSVPAAPALHTSAHSGAEVDSREALDSETPELSASVPASHERTPAAVAEVVPGENLLTFRSREGFQAFLDRARRQGIPILGVVDKLLGVRVGGPRSAIDELLKGFPEGEASVESNFFVRLPDSQDTPEKRAELGKVLPFGDQALNWLGVPSGSNSNWGQGVTIAVLDTAVDRSHPTFGKGQIAVIQIEGGGANSGSQAHGTAVASILSGRDSQTRGVAPGARLLSVPLVGADGSTTTLDLAAAILAASDAGANIINISLGGYGDSQVLREAVSYATRNNVLIVAAAGNESYGILAYPARYQDVLAVGAVDGYGQQLPFSNSGQTLGLMAPGLDVQVAAGQGEVSYFSGTSASAPFVSGAVAAILSESGVRGLAPRQAAELLLAHADEAGTPGSDSAYGRGILDVGRAMRSNQPGIVDAAIASVQPVADSVGNLQLQVIVENRGTAPLQNLLLGVALDGSSSNRELLVQQLKPDAIGVFEIPLPSGLKGSGEVLRFRTEITRLGSDIQPGNNVRQGIIRFSPPPAK